MLNPVHFKNERAGLANKFGNAFENIPERIRMGKYVVCSHDTRVPVFCNKIIGNIGRKECRIEWHSFVFVQGSQVIGRVDVENASKIFYKTKKHAVIPANIYD